MHERNIALDGIRGIAILYVVLFHATSGLGYSFWPVSQFLKFTHAGWLGVDIFFALSGYLITGILINQKNIGTSLGRYLSNFYLRRALRIFPLYFFVLILLLILPIIVPTLGGYEYRRFLDMQIWFWLHAANVARELYGLENPVLKFGWFELSHFWTLAVEEHYYFIWPLLVFFFPKRLLLIILIGIIFLSIGLKADLVAIPSILGATLKHLAGLAIGSWASLFPKHFGKLTVWIAVSIFTFSATYFDVTQENSWGFSPLLAVITACLCISVSSGSIFVTNVLTSSWLVTLGKYSYGIYVYHFILDPVYRRIDLHSFPGGYTVGAVAYVFMYLTIPFIVSILSYKWLEEPILRLKGRL